MSQARRQRNQRNPRLLHQPAKSQPRPEDRKAHLTVKIGIPDRTLAAAISESLRPETVERAGVRSRTRVKALGESVEMRIDASDLVALRAAFNSFMRFLLAAMKTVETVSAFNKPENLDVKERRKTRSHQK